MLIGRMNDISPTKPGKSPTKPGAGIAPRFVSGSILSHILLMTGTGALGLMAIFVGDLANILFLGPPISIFLFLSIEKF